MDIYRTCPTLESERFILRPVRDEDRLYELFSLITPKLEGMLGCRGVLTKAPIYAVERINAIRKAGFRKSEHLLVGNNGYAYDGYWTVG